MESKAHSDAVSRNTALSAAAAAAAVLGLLRDGLRGRIVYSQEQVLLQGDLHGLGVRIP